MDEGSAEIDDKVIEVVVEVEKWRRRMLRISDNIVFFKNVHFGRICERCSRNFAPQSTTHSTVGLVAELRAKFRPRRSHRPRDPETTPAHETRRQHSGLQNLHKNECHALPCNYTSAVDPSTGARQQ